jgi:hypothetical protein
MQIWVFFEDGAGGDSFANLLENADNVEALDDQKSWRIHRYVDYKPKFWMPCPDQNHCFTNLNKSARDTGYAFYKSSNALSERYVDLVNANKNVVVTSRDLGLNFLLSSDCLEILTCKQIKLLLKKRNSSNIYRDATIKNLLESKVPTHYNPIIHPNESNFDLIIYFEDLLDWTFVQQLASQLHLDISQDSFLHWQEIIQQKLFYTTPGIEYYQSYIDDQDIYRYTKLTTLNLNGAKSITHFG